MSSKVALILGSGPRVGAAVAASLSKAGFSVAVVSRKATEGTTPEGYTAIQGDLSDPATIPAIFSKVTSTLGSPSVVIYNAATLTPPPDQDSVLSIPATSLSGDLNTNTVTPYAAAQEAVKGYSSLPAGASPVFIYTGNAQNNLPLPVPLMTTLGVGKAGSAYWIAVADKLYAGKGYRYVKSGPDSDKSLLKLTLRPRRFFYADQRNEDGSMAGMQLDAEAHAQFYTSLAEGKTQDVPWLATFTKSKGYVKL